MRDLIKAAILSACSVVTFAMSASATPTTYAFSGHLTQAWPYEGWSFRPGAAFSGTLVYDPAAVTSSYDYIDRPDWKLTFHRSPVVSLDYRISGDSGDFVYSPPAEGGYAAVGWSDQAGLAWTGIDLRFQNYPVDGKPSLDVPASAYVGGLYPHASFLSIIDTAAHQKAETGADVDLEALFDTLPRNDFGFAVRFSDAARWSETPGVERVDGYLAGRVERLSAISSAVPEPGTWALMILGMGLVGTSLRRSRMIGARAELA